MPANDYLKGLKNALKTHEEFENNEDMQNDLEKLSKVEGASDKDIEKLKAAYPDCPQSLIDMLKLIDGTYWRKYGDITVAVPILASIDYTYPHYLLSAEQMLQSRQEHTSSISDIYGEWLDEWDEDSLDKRIDVNVKQAERLHISDCMNNGGTSHLYIDFSPVEDGVKGQVIEFVHDPDSYIVIADSFDEYLQNIIDEGYPFVDEYYQDY